MALKILYYHGLESKLSGEKRQFLERFGNVKAPEFEYRNLLTESLDTTVFNPDLTLDTDIVVGTSFGGLIASKLSEITNIPCLSFNPALYTNSLGWDLTQILTDKKRDKLAYIVLGEKDEVVLFEENYQYIHKNIAEPKKVIFEPNLAHRIPIDIFEKHTRNFFEGLNLIDREQVNLIQC